MDEDEELKKAKTELEEQKKAIKEEEQKQIKLIRRLILFLDFLAFLLIGVCVFWPDIVVPLPVGILAIMILIVSSWLSRKFTEFIFGKYEF